MPSIVGGLDIHRKQLTFDYLDTVTGEVSCGQVAPADRGHLRAWLAGRLGQVRLHARALQFPGHIPPAGARLGGERDLGRVLEPGQP